MMGRRILLGFFAVRSFCAFAQGDVDFHFSTAMYQWIEAKAQNKVSSLSVGSSFENGLAIAFDQLLKTDKWAVKAFTAYKYSLSWPASYKSVQLGQKPVRYAELPVSAVYYMYRKQNPTERLSFSLGEYSYVLHRAYDEAHAKIALEFVQDLKDQLKLSPYRGAVIEYKPTGVFGFLENVENHAFQWDDLVLKDSIKSNLSSSIDTFLNTYDYDKFKQLGLPINRGILIDGPPGTGKSFTAKVLMSNVLQQRYKNKATFLYVSARHVSRPENIVNIFEAARMLSPAMIFFEDIDLIAGTDRTERQEVKNELMQQLSGIEELAGVITIATTNYGDRIDPALRRAKRLGFHFTFPFPATLEKVALLKIFTKKFDTTQLDMRELVDHFEQMTGADIQDLTRLSSEIALLDKSVSPQGQIILKQSHYAQALKIKRTLSTKRSTPSGEP